MKKYNFPVLKNVAIRHFSLYKKNDSIDIDLTKDVFCLAGANGLGKSTFITIVNYALTGIVKNPNRDFTWYKSISGFYTKTKGFTSDFFDGRIDDGNRDLAEVTITFSIGEHEYTITRGFFETDELRYFSRKTDGIDSEFQQNLTSSELNDEFKHYFTKDINLTEFDQFVFLQCYVFTFDETHQLLFWNESLIEKVLYLFFGVDSSKAKLADQLRKDYNKYGSNARNLQYQITQARNEISIIKKNFDDSDFNNGINIEIEERYRILLESSDELGIKLKNLSEEIKEADLNSADYTLKASSMRSEYAAIFNKTLTDDTPIEKNPRIIEILKDLKLRIYAGDNFDNLLDMLVITIKEQQKEYKGKNAAEYFEQLRKIDTELINFSSKIKLAQLRKDRLIEEEKEFLLEYNECRIKILNLEKENETVLKNMQNSRLGGADTVLKNYQEQLERFTLQKELAYKLRTKVRQELGRLEEELNQGYIKAESDFIRIFNQYAKSFLGLDLSISLAISANGANLSIQIDDTKRKESFQLSESQRYFVDIALRMALIELCTNSATMLIDTPEGSLDIAYESRAGQMFADFAKKNHKVVLTANINSSQLLLELASKCKSSKMSVERMTDWTVLSEVQQQESQRIEDAYSKIDNILSS